MVLFYTSTALGADQPVTVRELVVDLPLSTIRLLTIRVRSMLAKTSTKVRLIYEKYNYLESAAHSSMATADEVLLRYALPEDIWSADFPKSKNERRFL